MVKEKTFDGQVAIVTGAGAGMGREHAKILAARGASVVVNDLSDSAKETVQIIEENGGKAVVNQSDVSSEEGVQQIVDDAINNFGRVDILVSNAGIINNVPFSEMTLEDFDKVMKVNAYGTFLITKAVWSHFVEQGYGRIILTSSSSAFISQNLIGHYAASKGAVLGLGKTLAVEGKEHGINVNILAPGAFTAMSGAMEDEEARKRMEERMNSALVAPVVGWLAHKDNNLNGQIIEASSGRAALNFIGSTPGYWNAELSIEDLFEHEDEVLKADGYKILENTTELSAWMTGETTGWDNV